MNTINRKKSVGAALGAAVAALAAPAMLFLGAGTAQAGTTVNTTTDALGVSVHIKSVGMLGAQSSGWCNYTAIPAAGEIGVPVYKVPFYLQPGGTHKLWFPGIQTGTKWDVTVWCPGGLNSPTVQKIY
jgi:hypothetical protein